MIPTSLTLRVSAKPRGVYDMKNLAWNMRFPVIWELQSYLTYLTLFEQLRSAVIPLKQSFSSRARTET